MDWIKVLNRHILVEYCDLRDSEFVAWIKIMALTATLEHEPTRGQMLKYVHYKTLDSLQNKLNKHSIDLQYVLNKVLIDVQYVLNRRECSKINTQRFRNKQRGVSDDVSITSLHREEKRREDIKKESIKKEKIVFDGTHFQSIPDSLFAKWKEIAPGINLAAEVAKAELWVISNPQKRRSRWSAFLSNWMVKAQDHFIKYGGFNGNRTRNSGGGSGIQTTPPEWTSQAPISEEARSENLTKLRELTGGLGARRVSKGHDDGGDQADKHEIRPAVT